MGLQAALRVAVLILFAALLMLPFQPPNSAEFVVTVLAAAVGLTFAGMVILLARLSGSRPPNRRPVDRVSGMSSNVRSEESGRDK